MLSVSHMCFVSIMDMGKESDDQFNDWGGRGCNIFVPVLVGNGTKIAPTGDIFDQPPPVKCDIFGASLPTM